jgi:hypothetical protein
VVAAGLASDGVGTLDVLGVEKPGGRFGVAALGGAQLFAHDREDLLGDPVLFPADEVPVHGLPRREISWQRPPGAASAHDVEDRVEHVAAWMLLRPASALTGGSNGSISAHCSSLVSEGYRCVRRAIGPPWGRRDCPDFG